MWPVPRERSLAAEDPIEKHRRSCHATRTSKPWVQRLPSPILSTNPCLHISTQHGMDPEQQSGTRQRKSQLEWTACASTRPPLQPLPKDAETVRLDHFLFHFVGFVFFGVTGVAVGVPAMFTLTRDTFCTSFSIVVWGRAGMRFTPSMSRVTVDAASICMKKRLWRSVTVPFSKARELPKSSDSNQRSLKFFGERVWDGEIQRHRTHFLLVCCSS